MSESMFVVLTPVKPFARGKSRLTGVPDDRRRSLAEAFAHDTLDAVATCGAVAHTVVVTSEESLAGSGEYVTLPDAVPGDLNASLRAAAREAAVWWPGLRPVALCGDLPALTADVLTDALREAVVRAPAGAAFVPDATGTGTTLFTAPYEVFTPRFGPGSRAAHLGDGAVELNVDRRLRQDVDTPEDLDRVATLGVGVHTAEVLLMA